MYHCTCEMQAHFSLLDRVPGDVIAFDEGTSRFFSFNVGKVLISISTFEVINQMINLEVNGKLYQVRELLKNKLLLTVLCS